MKSFLIYLLFFATILLTSCQKKEIKIPVIGVSGIQEVSNFSEVWMFMKIQEQDTVLQLNDHNLIGATNWIFNIDKHLTLEQLVPKIQYFQEKRIKKSLHSKEGFNNYLSYADTLSNTLSFVDISHIQFHFDSIQSRNTILKNLDFYRNFDNYHLLFGVHTYYINGIKIAKTDFFVTLQEQIAFTKSENQVLCHLNFNQKISYQEYISIKTQLLQLKKNSILLDANEYIFDADKIPECGCDS